MTFIKHIFGALQLTYLIRAYVLSAVFMALMAWMTVSLPETRPMPDRLLTLVPFGIGALLFPFSKLVWDEIKRVLMGGNVFYMNAIILLGAKFIVNLILWGFSIFIAPVGILYLWLRSRQASANA